MDNKKKLSGQELIDAIIKFNNDPEVQKLASFYSNQSVPEIFGVSRREVSHSAFLSWLFTTNANHGLGEKPLMQLLELYLKCCRDQNKVSTDGVQLEQILSVVLTRLISLLSTDVQTEEAVAIDKAKGRADIVIACNVHIPDNLVKKISIIIENKIYSEEHKEQTQTYFNYHKNKKRNDEEVCLYIYLTPPANKDAKCPAFVHLTYQDVLDSILEPLLVQSNLSDRTKFIITEYINNLSIPSDYIDEKNITKKARTIMAINTKERELLQSFWDKHLDLFITALTSIATDENASDEVKDAANKIVKEVNTLVEKKKNYKYSINNQGEYRCGRVVVELIREYIENNTNATIYSINKNFKLRKKNQQVTDINSANSANISTKRYFTEFPLQLSNGEMIAVSNQWSNDEKFENFLEVAKELIPNCSVKRVK